MRRAFAIGAVLLAIAGLAVALLPFERPGQLHDVTVQTGNEGTFVHLSHECAPPIVSAFRHDDIPGGWFGYAPLSGTILSDRPLPDTIPFVDPVCQPSAQNRLDLALTLWVAAVALLLFRGPRPSAVAQLTPA